MDELRIQTDGTKAGTYVTDREGRSLSERVRAVRLRADAGGETVLELRLGPDYRLVAG